MEASGTSTPRRRSKANQAASDDNGAITVTMSEYDRETKNAFRFQEDLKKGQDRGDVGTVYVLKSALEKAGIDPDGGIVVTIMQLD